MNIKAIILAVYIYYMFILFETTININHPFEIIFTSIDDYFKHPISSDIYESKVCPFGKQIIFVLILYLLYDGFIGINNKNVRKIFLIGTIILSLMNMNVFVYLIPYYIYEIYEIYERFI